jgi:mono/diheme cytochrome c family protein
MRVNQIKFIAIILFAFPLLLLAMFKATPVKVAASVPDDAATYKAKCAMCHTATASKFFDPAKPEAEQVQVILKGKKGEKPPYMPGFAEKGMTEDEAKALAAYMKTLKPAN